MVYRLGCRAWQEADGRLLVGEDEARLLSLVRERGSLSAAAREMDVPYRHARQSIRRIERTLGAKVIVSRRGGAGTTVLTAEGRRILLEYESQVKRLQDQLEHMYRNPTLTADGIVLVDDKVVLIKRGREPGKGMFALPGGFVEYGERTEDCAVREVEEETGLRTEVLDLVGVYSDPARDPRGHLVSAVYHLHPVGGALRSGDDAADVALFPLDGLPPLPFDHARILADFVRMRGRR